MRIDGPQITGSFSLNGDAVGDLEALVTTSSLNTYTSSMTTTMGHVNTATHSLNTFTSSAITRLNSIEGVSGSYATTGSNLFIGTQTLSGSIIPSVNNTYDLGSVGYNFRHLYLSSASLYIDGTKVLGSTSQELQITTDAGQSFKILEAGSDTITLQSADGNITLATSGGGDVILDPTTGVVALKGTTQVYAGNKIRSSDGNNIVFGDGLTVSGSVTITGFIEAQELRTTYISSSILYRSGSTKFGDELTDTHAFTGSLLVSGTISVPGSNLISGSSQVLNGSGIWSGSAQLPSGVVSGSAQITLTATTGFGSYLNQAVLTTSNPTFNSVVSGDYRYTGTGYITYDTDNAGTNSLIVRKYGTTVLTLNSNGYLGINVNPSYYLDVQANVANSFYTIAQFENKDYTSGTRTFIRVRNWLTAGGSYSSYFGQGQDGKTYIIANNSARGGDIVIDGGSGKVGIGGSPTELLDLISTDPILRFTPSVSGNYVFFQKLSTSNGDYFRLYDGTAYTMMWKNGRIGLGGDTPGAKLSLLQTSDALTSGFRIYRANGTDWQEMYMTSGLGTLNDPLNYYSSYAGAVVHAVDRAGQAYFASNLGIGTSSPGYNIDVQGTEAKIQLKSTATGGGTWVMASTYNSWSAGGGKYVITSDGGTGGIKFSINSSGQVGVNTYSQSARFEVKASGDEDLIVGRYSGGSAKLFYVYQSSADGYLELRTGADTTITKLSGYAGTQAFMNTKLTVGGTGSYTAATLNVEGAGRFNRSTYAWYQGGTNDWDGWAYLHLKTNMWAGGSPSGNIHYTMSLFYARLYSYSSNYIREGHLAFHNWSGSIYSLTTTGTAWSNAYTSSDGYVVLVLALGSGSYLGVTVDWHQAYGYPLQDKIVTNTSRSNSTSGVY